MIDYVKRLAGPYTGTGQTTFSFGFKVYEETDIYVATALSNDEAATNLNYGDDYSVTLNDDQDAAPGGSITLKTALVDGEILVIGSDLDYTQELQLTNYTRFPPEQINEALDRLCIQIQQILEITGRALLVPATSSTTPTEMIERLLSAQHEAQASADVATNAASESQKILDQVKEYGAAATVLEPYADDISTVAGNIDSVKATGGNITNVNIVAGDLDTTTQPVDLDYGDYDDNTGSGTAEVAVGGSIKTVADNIAQVQNVSANMASILAIEEKIDGLDATIETMNQQVAASTANAQAAEGSATDSANSATESASQADLSQDWAIKLDGKVIEAGVEIDFSSKYWAQQAASSATSAEATLTLVTQAGESAVSDIQSAQTTAVQAVSSQQSTSVNAVTQAQTTAVNAVRNQQTTSVDAVNTAGSQQTANAKAQADAAAASATAAAQSASAASDSADSASASATSAASSASTATTQATTATTQAGLATTAKNDAESARNAAQTAQAAAEAAQASAEEIAGSLGDPLGKEEAASTYATKTELSTGLAGKQATGDYATNAALTQGLAGKQDVGDYATNSALNTGLSAKANTADLGALATLDTVATAQLNDSAVTVDKLATEIDLGDYDA